MRSEADEDDSEQNTSAAMPRSSLLMPAPRLRAHARPAAGADRVYTTEQLGHALYEQQHAGDWNRQLERPGDRLPELLTKVSRVTNAFQK